MPWLNFAIIDQLVYKLNPGSLSFTCCVKSPLPSGYYTWFKDYFGLTERSTFCGVTVCLTTENRVFVVLQDALTTRFDLRVVNGIPGANKTLNKPNISFIHVIFDEVESNVHPI